MRYVVVHDREILDAMKASLRDLQNVKLLSPNDLDILSLLRELRAKIADLEEREEFADVEEDSTSDLSQ